MLSEGDRVYVELPDGFNFVGTVVDRLSGGQLLVEDTVGNERVVDPDDTQTAIDRDSVGGWR